MKCKCGHHKKDHNGYKECQDSSCSCKRYSVPRRRHQDHKAEVDREVGIIETIESEPNWNLLYDDCGHSAPEVSRPRQRKTRTEKIEKKASKKRQATTTKKTTTLPVRKINNPIMDIDL